ncbi:hypothetical protein F5B22DRAFT_283957 [Xylaria bambusicola]|uniref:uncharacterized protein n=1 Tax=Xylaria bambusicola TaxID=326684 RepID=UPI0020087A25|nr:uncharacterized protein F5B22DRAFT_283957 [Xylaria bambusicola]KAI0513030.1 hypothetical protein F5B22DRAFT_283957 [Xylaria bambusicola]
MLSQLATLSGLLAVVSLFTPSVEAAKKMTAVRFETRANDYLWTVQWTGPTKCTSWPCGYSYRVSGPTYTAAEGAVPFFNATCTGTVDKPLQACTLQPGSAAVAVSGNFSTFETSGVGSGLIDVTARYIDQASFSNRTLTAVTPMQASAANQNTWTVEPQGCPVSACDVAKATRSLRRGTLGIAI